MHLLNLRQIVFISTLLHVSYCQRRIVNGEKVNEPKRYVVYLVESRVSPMDYDEWLCGGALVTSDFIVTSAACVEDVKHLYAIAGYEKYVTKEELYKDKCTSKMKKKIVFTCVPKSYELDYGKLEKWSFIDIGVAQVESPYRFDDKDFEMLCSYIPQPIEINFEIKYQVEGIDAIALGWGHRNKWRLENDKTSYNNVTLQYTPILIADKEECKKEYENYKGMNKVIDTYMICSIKAGNIDSKGALREKSKPIANGCPGHEDNIEQLMGFDNKSCEPAVETDDMSWVEDTRRLHLNNKSDIVENVTKIFRTNTRNIEIIERMNTRRNGICQNDHGGPIVTWIGSEEYLIAVASVFKVTKDMECTGPFLYTSTECNGAFLACVLGLEKNEERRRKMCSGSPVEKGFDTVETHISWQHHPDGPSDKERVKGSLTSTPEILQRARLSDVETVNTSLPSKTQPTKTSLAVRKPKLEDVLRLLYNDGVNESVINTTTPKLTTKQTIQQIESRLLYKERNNGSLANTTTPILTTKHTIQQIENRFLYKKGNNGSLENTTTSMLTNKKPIQQIKARVTNSEQFNASSLKTTKTTLSIAK